MNQEEIRTIKYRGIDDFNRPVFKVLEKKYYIGSTSKLFSHDVKESEVINYFKDNINQLEFFGHSFNCEPEGGKLKDNIKLVIVTIS
jgi:hypothetical protein